MKPVKYSILTAIMILSCLAGLHAQDQKPRRPVTINLKEGPPQTGSLIRADSETVEIESARGVKISIATERIISIVFAADTRSRTITASDNSQVANAFRALGTLAPATEVGISKRDYEVRLIDAKAVVEASLERITESALTNEIELALFDYEMASVVWDYMITLRARLNVEYLSASDNLAQRLIKRYPGVFNERDFPLKQNRLLSAVWNSARKHVDTAKAMLR